MPDRGKFLVTGAAGLIGSAVIWALNQRGDERIIAVDRLDRTEKWRNLAPLRFDDYIDADALGDKIELGLLNEVRAVVHLGACSSTTETDARYLVENNCNYTKMLAEWTLQRGIRFVYASSAATYGAIEGRVSEEDRSITALRPLNMYGYSKQLFDLHAAKRGYLDRIAGLKYFNVFGPNENHKGDMRSVVNKAFQQIQESGRVRLFKSYRPEFADGEQRRDFLYVKDAVDMTLHLVDDLRANGLFNIGSGTIAYLARARRSRLCRAGPAGAISSSSTCRLSCAASIRYLDRGVDRSAARDRLRAANQRSTGCRARLRDAISRDGPPPWR